MVDMPRLFRRAPAGRAEMARAPRVGLVPGILEPARQASLGALFPTVRFETVEPNWPDRDPDRDILIVPVAGGRGVDLEAAVARLRRCSDRTAVLVVLTDADVTTTRWLIREGAADVLPAPLSEPALALSLERLLRESSREGPTPGHGRIIALLKGGGGAGATSLGVQAAAHLARAGQDICFADLDVQFGDAAFHLDLADAPTVTDCLAAGATGDVALAGALARHACGLRMLAAPREVVSVDAFTVAQMESLISGLRRGFALTLADLPPTWSNWTRHVLSQSEAIVLVTQLTAPHVRAAQRQFEYIRAQGLDDKPIILVCNAAPRGLGAVSRGAAERALGRRFDVVAPADPRTMHMAAAQGVELAAVRRGSGVEKAVAELARRLAQPVTADARA